VSSAIAIEAGRSSRQASAMEKNMARIDLGRICRVVNLTKDNQP
jgi:hypothetical protein